MINRSVSYVAWYEQYNILPSNKGTHILQFKYTCLFMQDYWKDSFREILNIIRNKLIHEDMLENTWTHNYKKSKSLQDYFSSIFNMMENNSLPHIYDKLLGISL